MVLAVTEQITLVDKRFPYETQRGTIGKIAIRCLVQSHPPHQVRFNNPARRSDSPTGITETKEKIVKNQQPQLEQKHKNHKDNKLRYSQLEFLPVRRNKLPYNMPDCNETPADTERMQTKFEYSAEGTNNAAKTPHQMSLFIKQRENINTSKEMPQK